MNLSLKKILKHSNVLFISELDNSFKKIENILNLFFKKIYYTNSLEKANIFYEDFFPNVVVIDINLNEANGINFIKELRKRNKNLPVIVITNLKDTNILLEAIKLNLIDYLLKPLDLNKLINALNYCAKQILNNGDILTIVKNEYKYDYIRKMIINNKEEIKLTKNEARLLEIFLANKNRYIKNEDIKKIIWSQKDISDSAFKSLINRLSIKINKDVIDNSFGMGYGIFD
jgi:DNA-binding response OmpR family regulator